MPSGFEFATSILGLDMKYKPKSIPEVLKRENVHTFWHGSLSQWAAQPFLVYNSELGKIERFPTAEHYMMAQKAVMFKDIKMRDKIMSARTPKEAKELGRLVSNFDEYQWNRLGVKVVRMGNVLRGMQNEHFRKELLSTGDKILIEASPYDRIWGVGLDSFAPAILQPTQWPGQNRLGFILMEVRDILRAANL